MTAAEIRAVEREFNLPDVTGCAICGEDVTDIRPGPTRACEQLLNFTLFSLQLDRYDLCWACWDGAAEQFEAWWRGMVRP